MESRGPALPGVCEEDRGRFSSKFKTSTQLKSRTSQLLTKSTCLSTSSTLEAFTPLTEAWVLKNSGRPTQGLAVSASQQVKICNLQLFLAQPHTILETMISVKRDSYSCSHLCSIPILNPQLAQLLFHCFRSLELFHTSHVLPKTMNVSEEKLLFFPPQVCQCRYECNLWRISSLFPWESRPPRQYLLSETIFG